MWWLTSQTYNIMYYCHNQCLIAHIYVLYFRSHKVHCFLARRSPTLCTCTGYNCTGWHTQIHRLVHFIVKPPAPTKRKCFIVSNKFQRKSVYMLCAMNPKRFLSSHLNAGYNWNATSEVEFCYSINYGKRYPVAEFIRLRSSKHVL